MAAVQNTSSTIILLQTLNNVPEASILEYSGVTIEGLHKKKTITAPRVST
jgi:hypothetical protein